MKPIDIASLHWTVTLLPLPKRHARGTAYGFCGGFAVGRVESTQGKTSACWWPAGEPVLLSYAEKSKDLTSGRPSGGDRIPGHRLGRAGAMNAVMWRQKGAELEPVDLHDPGYAGTWATGAGSGAVVGMGTPKGKLGERGPDVGLLWRSDAKPVVIKGSHDVTLTATDGTRLAGSIGGRAVLWPTADATPVDLAPQGRMPSEVQALDGELQAGIGWQGICARALLWKGSAASCIDLTPAGFEVGRALGAGGGLQVGFLRAKDNTRNGSTALDDRATLWQGSPDRRVDLNSFLPESPYNASVAWSIQIADGRIVICGEASRYEISDPDTPRESHYVPIAHPVLWTAPLGGA